MTEPGRAGVPDDPGAADLGAEARRLCDAAAGAGVPLRMIGSLAVALRCPRRRDLAALLGRRPPRDIDLVTYARHEAAVERLLQDAGYLPDPRLRHSREFGVKRLIYQRPAGGPGGGAKVDVFIDELVMAHTVDFAGRLELDEPTVTLADLLLSKLQIHEITEGDLIDLAVLLAEHDLDGGRGGIDAGHVGRVLGADWGFHHSALGNLDRLAAAIGRWPPLPDGVAERLAGQAAALRDAIEAAPKTRRWRLRARLGERVRWYEEVDEVGDGGA